jgi:hypothetical protein
MTLEIVDDKGKEFPSREGVRRKYMLHFNGNSGQYSAEFCPLKDSEEDRKVKTLTGSQVWFKIRFRKDFGDEIELVQATTGNGNGDSARAPVVSLHGHPASLALLAAKDILVARIGMKEKFITNEGPLKTSTFMAELLEDAEIIYEWLIAQTNKT